MSREKFILMVGTSFNGMGGVASVVNGYRDAGLFEKFKIRYLATHSNGTRITKILYFVKSWCKFLIFLVQGKIAVLHAHTSSKTSFWRKLFFFIPARPLRVPVVLHLHGGAFDVFYESRRTRFAQFVIRKTLDSVSSIIVLSETRRRWIESLSDNRIIITIYNAVPLNQVTPFECREPQTILFLGQLGEHKGVYDLLRAVANLRKNIPKVKLLLAGNGPQEGIRAAVLALGLQGNVEILGWVAGEKKSDLLRRSAIYALPSYAEGMPMSVLEAMAAGVPIVATAVGGIPEAITHGREGFLVPPGDIGNLTLALLRLLDHPEIRKQMGNAARTRVERQFSYQQAIPQIAALYSSLEEGKPTS
jgi:glycosyltransferase involved in cell wall biosynthesis